MLVMVESPYAGDIERNTRYAQRAMLDSLRRGEAPFVMHLLYPQVLDENNPEERAKGIAQGLRWLERADLVALYIDYGVSSGMEQAFKEAVLKNIPTTYRLIGQV